MALPSLERTWQYQVNQQVGSGGTLILDAQAQMYRLKQLLTGFASNPWTVVRSGNSTTTGTSDLWTGTTALVWNSAGSAHSWIVLQQTGVTGGPLQICIDLNQTSSNSNNCTVVASVAGFTGGTTTARPTATDEQVVINGGQWTWSSSGSSVFHAFMSNDGASTRVVLVVGGIVRTVFFFDTLMDTAITTRYACAVVRGDPPAHSHVYGTAAFSSKFNTTNCTAFVGSEAYSTGLVCTANSGAVSNITGQYPITPISLHTETAGARGRLGRLADVWFGSSGVPSGSTYPITPDDKEFIQLGCFVFPWNGTAPIMA